MTSCLNKTRRRDRGKNRTVYKKLINNRKFILKQEETIKIVLYKNIKITVFNFIYAGALALSTWIWVLL